MRILLVEDDLGVQTFVSRGLREESFAVDVAGDGEVGYERALQDAYDAVILDLMLPGMDGLTIVRGLRARKITTPILCLTARDAIRDRVAGLNAGADDYLPKPFSFSELLARLRALLRRGTRFTGDVISIDDLTLDPQTHVVTRRGARIELSRREFALLQYLALYAGEAVSRTALLEHVWDTNQDPFSNVVDVHVNRLRRKIDHGFDRPLIHTIRGVGYALRAD
ncbi:MAG TPA: response regulator transcription factor [Phycisphaerae bacterium]